LSAWHAFDDVRFSPDGSRIAVGGMAPAILDARTHRTFAGLAIERDQVVFALRYSPDGRTLFAITGWSVPELNPATMLQRFDARSGRALGRARIVSQRLVFVNLLVTPDGRIVTSSPSDAATIYDASTLRPLGHLPVRAQRAALAPDGHTMLAGARDGSVRFVDLDTGAVDTASMSHSGAVTAAAFTADGRRAVTAAADGHAIVWDVARRTAVETLGAHAGAITALALPRDGATLYTAGADGRILVWDLDGTRRLGRPFAVPAAARPDLAPAWALSADGRRLVLGDREGRITVIDARTLRALSGRLPVVPHGPVTGLGFLPRGRGTIAVGGNGFLAIVDPASGRTVTRLPGHDGWVGPPSFSRDGREMATASDGGVVQAWSLPSGRRIGARVDLYPDSYDLTGVSLSPDGRTMAVTTTGAVEIVDVATHRRRTVLTGAETVSEPAHFTPDGRFVVAGSREGWARLWSPATGRPVSRTLAGHAGALAQTAVSNNGRTLATGSTDGNVQLWDLRTERPVGPPLPGAPDHAVSPGFTPDGATLFTVTTAQRAFRWDVRPSTWARLACRVAGRRLTRAEWDDVLPDRPYAPACAN
jgi:WD40 repeat protein